MKPICRLYTLAVSLLHVTGSGSSSHLLGGSAPVVMKTTNTGVIPQPNFPIFEIYRLILAVENKVHRGRLACMMLRSTDITGKAGIHVNSEQAEKTLQAIFKKHRGKKSVLLKKDFGGVYLNDKARRVCRTSLPIFVSQFKIEQFCGPLSVFNEVINDPVIPRRMASYYVLMPKLEEVLSRTLNFTAEELHDVMLQLIQNNKKQSGNVTALEQENSLNTKLKELETVKDRKEVRTGTKLYCILLAGFESTPNNQPMLASYLNRLMLQNNPDAVPIDTRLGESFFRTWGNSDYAKNTITIEEVVEYVKNCEQKRNDANFFSFNNMTDYDALVPPPQLTQILMKISDGTLDANLTIMNLFQQQQLSAIQLVVNPTSDQVKLFQENLPQYFKSLRNEKSPSIDMLGQLMSPTLDYYSELTTIKGKFYTIRMEESGPKYKKVKKAVKDRRLYVKQKKGAATKYIHIHGTYEPGDINDNIDITPHDKRVKFLKENLSTYQQYLKSLLHTEDSHSEEDYVKEVSDLANELPATTDYVINKDEFANSFRKWKKFVDDALVKAERQAKGQKKILKYIWAADMPIVAAAILSEVYSTVGNNNSHNLKTSLFTDAFKVPMVKLTAALSQIKNPIREQYSELDFGVNFLKVQSQLQKGKALGKIKIPFAIHNTTKNTPTALII